LLITTDAHQFIVDYKVMEDGRDASQIPSLKERIKEKFKDQKYTAIVLIRAFTKKKTYVTFRKQVSSKSSYLKVANSIRKKN
jgi:hypothetical protein